MGRERILLSDQRFSSESNTPIQPNANLQSHIANIHAAQVRVPIRDGSARDQTLQKNNSLKKLSGIYNKSPAKPTKRFVYDQ